MNYEKQIPVNQANIDAYKHALANPSEEQQINNRVEAARNIMGYEAVFDPDKAVTDLGKLAIEEAEDALNPQHQPEYEALEGGRFDFLDEAATDPNHTIQDGLAARQRAEASITSHVDGTHTLSWEAKPEVTVNNSGQVVENSTEFGQ